MENVAAHITAVLVALVAGAVSIGAAGAPPPAGRRIVSLAPSVTETLFALGEGSEVVGVSRYCDYAPAARLPRIGTFLTPEVEAIAALRPTLIIGPGLSSSQRQVRALRAMGYPTMTVDDETSLEGVERTIERIGVRTGHAQAARRLLGSIRARIAAVRARLKGVKPRTVVMLVGHQPMVAVGRGTYLDDLLRIAGGDNIADPTPQSWPQLSLEYIISMRPEVILDGQMGNDSGTPAGFWSRYPTIPAVRSHRVFGYPQDPVLHPGPRVARSLEILARLIHPEAFADSRQTPASSHQPADPHGPDGVGDDGSR